MNRGALEQKRPEAAENPADEEYLPIRSQISAPSIQTLTQST